jgi:hypothetical protein
MMVDFTINLAEINGTRKPAFAFAVQNKQIRCSKVKKRKQMSYRTIFFRLKETLKINNEPAKRIRVILT